MRIEQKYWATILSACLGISTLICQAQNVSPEKSKVICFAPLANNVGDQQYESLAQAITDMLCVSLAEQENIKVVMKNYGNYDGNYGNLLKLWILRKLDWK